MYLTGKTLPSSSVSVLQALASSGGYDELLTVLQCLADTEKEKCHQAAMGALVSPQEKLSVAQIAYGRMQYAADLVEFFTQFRQRSES